MPGLQCMSSFAFVPVPVFSTSNTIPRYLETAPLVLKCFCWARALSHGFSSRQSRPNTHRDWASLNLNRDVPVTNGLLYWTTNSAKTVQDYPKYLHVKLEYRLEFLVASTVTGICPLFVSYSFVKNYVDGLCCSQGSRCVSCHTYQLRFEPG